MPNDYIDIWRIEMSVNQIQLLFDIAKMQDQLAELNLLAQSIPNEIRGDFPGLLLDFLFTDFVPTLGTGSDAENVVLGLHFDGRFELIIAALRTGDRNVIVHQIQSLDSH